MFKLIQKQQRPYGADVFTLLGRFGTKESAEKFSKCQTSTPDPFTKICKSGKGNRKSLSQLWNNT